LVKKVRSSWHRETTLREGKWRESSSQKKKGGNRGSQIEFRRIPWPRHQQKEETGGGKGGREGGRDLKLKRSQHNNVKRLNKKDRRRWQQYSTKGKGEKYESLSKVVVEGGARGSHNSADPNLKNLFVVYKRLGQVVRGHSIRWVRGKDKRPGGGKKNKICGGGARGGRQKARS